jgi:hypothetical protein
MQVTEFAMLSKTYRAYLNLFFNSNRTNQADDVKQIEQHDDGVKMLQHTTSPSTPPRSNHARTIPNWTAMPEPPRRTALLQRLLEVSQQHTRSQRRSIPSMAPNSQLQQPGGTPGGFSGRRVTISYPTEPSQESVHQGVAGGS